MASRWQVEERIRRMSFLVIVDQRVVLVRPRSQESVEWIPECCKPIDGMLK
jgi:hypothetical protein